MGPSNLLSTVGGSVTPLPPPKTGYGEGGGDAVGGEVVDEEAYSGDESEEDGSCGEEQEGTWCRVEVWWVYRVINWTF